MKNENEHRRTIEAECFSLTREELEAKWKADHEAGNTFEAIITYQWLQELIA